MSLVYVLFFLSGISGLIYQVIWVRAFGNAFGNTVYSSSLIIAIFMLGLGAGSYAAGVWADRRYARAPDSLLRAYGVVELAVAALAAIVSLLLPKLAAVSAALSAYVVDDRGWYELSAMSYVARGTIGIALLTPITMLMGGTLTLLIRHRVRRQVDLAPWTIATLYAVNTAGAAAGAFLTDFLLVRALGLFDTQMVAVALNLVAGLGALWLAGHAHEARGTTKNTKITKLRTTDEDLRDLRALRGATVVFVSLSLALTGFSTLGMEIVWLRHVTLLLGGFRSVFSLLLTVILIGIGSGALIGTAIERRTGRAAPMLMAVQTLFIVTTLAGLAAANMASLAATQQAIDLVLPAMSTGERWWAQLWFNARPILIEAGLPSLVIGCSFPLANAIVQRAEATVGRRAGVLYFANTAGAVAGALTAGFVLLPLAGMQRSATILMVAAALAIVPLALAEGGPEGSPLRSRRQVRWRGLFTAAAAAIAIGVWMAQPPDLILRRAHAPQSAGEHLIATTEGINEVLSVAEIPGRGRALITNGHAMSSTARLDQRYMRALAHIPLLSMVNPSSVMVIGFGVGNTTHAASLYPSVTRIDVADLSRNVLEHAAYFADANHGVLRDPRLRVFVNDGRLHLQMQPQSTYDLITLEPPPIAHAGVAALYSREFYALARSRLKSGGYLTQWLPAYQVPAETTLAMVRAFTEVFPQSVLLSGMQAELLLVGTTASAIEIDPARIAAAFERAPAARADAAAVDLGTPTEIVGTFVGSADTLARATRGSPIVADDMPLQEYGVSSVVGTGLRGVPASLFDLTAVDRWCPRCLDGNDLVPAVAGLDSYLALLDEAYHAPIADVVAAASMRAAGSRRVLGSTYLGAVVPDSPRANELIADAEYDLGSRFLERGDYQQAAAHLLAAVQARPDSAAAHNDLGVALASSGSLAQAVDHFRRAIALQPQFTQARDNLTAALRARDRRGS